jgi:hypothetical protein
MTPKAGRDMEQQELSCMGGCDAKWCGCFGRRLAAIFSQAETQVNHDTASKLRYLYE